MRVGRQIVGHEIAADRDVLRDRFAMISRNTRGKVLRSFDAARCGFDGVSGNRYRSAGAAGIGVQQVLTDKNLLRRIGREHIGLAHVRDDRDVLNPRRKLGHSNCDFGSAGSKNPDGLFDRTKSRCVNLDHKLSFLSRGRQRDLKSPVRPSGCLSSNPVTVDQLHGSVRQSVSIRIDDAALQNDLLRGQRKRQREKK